MAICLGKHYSSTKISDQNFRNFALDGTQPMTKFFLQSDLLVSQNRHGEAKLDMSVTWPLDQHFRRELALLQIK